MSNVSNLPEHNPTLEAALGYLGRGWTVIDLPPRTKKPDREGWQNERHDEEALRERLAAGQERNLSVLLGEPSDGPTLRVLRRPADLRCPPADRKSGTSNPAAR